MKKYRVYVLSLALLIATFYGCQNDENLPTVVDPKEAILGKWEVIENSYGPISYPGSYDEYLPDSILSGRNSDGMIYHKKYWITDSLLFKRSTYHIYEGPGFEETHVVTDAFRFEFLSHDRLKLKLQKPAIVTMFIYKRIE